jgi:hypothetical protein
MQPGRTAAHTQQHSKLSIKAARRRQISSTVELNSLHKILRLHLPRGILHILDGELAHQVLWGQPGCLARPRWVPCSQVGQQRKGASHGGRQDAAPQRRLHSDT